MMIEPHPNLLVEGRGSRWVMGDDAPFVHVETATPKREGERGRAVGLVAARRSRRSRGRWEPLPSYRIVAFALASPGGRGGSAKTATQRVAVIEPSGRFQGRGRGRTVRHDLR
jgi:hypothetical protein